MVIQQALRSFGNQTFRGHASSRSTSCPSSTAAVAFARCATIATDQQHGGAGAIEESAIA